eukprot:11164745-Lingulodinium_polyedra.AAC.1
MRACVARFAALKPLRPRSVDSTASQRSVSKTLLQCGLNRRFASAAVYKSRASAFRARADFSIRA